MDTGQCKMAGGSYYNSSYAVKVKLFEWISVFGIPFAHKQIIHRIRRTEKVSISVLPYKLVKR
jgi:hypothetical protein